LARATGVVTSVVAARDRDRGRVRVAADSVADPGRRGGMGGPSRRPAHRRAVEPWMTVRDVRVPRARLILAAAALIVCAALLLLTRTYTFYFDEWTFITSAPDWTLRSYLEPHNEHPVLLLKGLYAAMLSTVGLRAYWPYMAGLLLAHAANVVLLFELVRRRAGDLIAIAAALIMLVLGAGWVDLLLAFQLGWLAPF